MGRGRPREHDLDVLLDHARSLWVEQGTSGVTIRALSARSGVGNGSIYNAFRSRINLLARVWAREAAAFLAFQRELAERALAQEGAQAAVTAAALAPAAYSRDHEEAARLLLAVGAGELLDSELADAERDSIKHLQATLGVLIGDLAEQLWGRRDPVAVVLVKVCLVDLPGTLLLSSRRLDSPVAQHALTQAVRGITDSEPPDPPARHPGLGQSGERRGSPGT